MTVPGAPLLRWWGRQRWIPFGVRDRVLRRLADPDAMASTPFVCDLFGLRYEGDLASFIDWTIYFYGCYERAVLTLLADAAALAGPRAVFLDVGANVGQHALILSRRVAQVHAFEPWDKARRRLERNLALNAVTNVTVHALGLGEHDKDLTFHAPASANWGTGSFVPEVNLNRSDGTLPVLRGDTALAQRGIGRVDLIKIDTEGFEIKVLSGLAETIARHRPVVVCEMSGPTLAEAGPDPLATLNRLFGPGWTFLDLGHHMERYRLRPFRGGGEVITLVAAPDELAPRLRRRG